MLRLAAVWFVLSYGGLAASPNELIGRWKVVSIAGAGPVTAISGSAAARTVGQPLVLTRSSVSFARQACRATYQESRESVAEVSQEYKIDGKALKLPDPVTRIEAECTEIFIRTRDTIVFTWNGYFLEAVRLPSASRK